ncbi:MAG: 50S ribosomal protein L29 [Chitinophagaceae bacterium]|nr:50S ribosomal protein L29 [Chitinophagaceae bacterium]
MKNKIDIKAYSLEDLYSKIEIEKNTLLKLKLAHSITPIENPKRISVVRKTIAMIYTEISIRKSKPIQ